MLVSKGPGLVSLVRVSRQVGLVLRVKAGSRKTHRDVERQGERQMQRGRYGQREKETLKRKTGRDRYRGKRGATLAFHSHPSTHRGAFSGVLSRRNTHKSSMKQPWKLKPVHSCPTAPSAPVSPGMRTARAPPAKAQLWDK